MPQSVSAPIATSAADCCAVCPDVPITQVPGPAGAAGAAGSNGTNGANSFSTTSAGYTQPAVGATVSVTVVSSAFAIIGADAYVENGGYYLVTAIADSTHVTLQNRGYTGNAAPTTVIGSGQRISLAGVRGVAGAAGPATLNGISPTTTRGDIIADDGGGAGSASDVRFPAGTDGQQLTALAAQPTGLIYRTITPNAATDNVVPRFDSSGATTPTPLQASGLLVSDTGAVQSTPTGGNARGASAIDLQPVRGAATQVASGANSTIAGGLNNTGSGARSAIGGGTTNLASGSDSSIGGGQNNTASSTNSTVGGGSANTASGDASVVAGGFTNVASGQVSTVGGGQGATAAAQGSTVSGGTTNQINAAGTGAVIAGGDSNTNLGDVYASIGGGNFNQSQGTNLADYSTIPGGLFAQADLYGQVAHASGRFATSGDAQASELIWRIKTTGVTQTEMFLDGASRRAIVWGFSSWAFHGHVIARNTTTDNSAIWEFKGAIKRSAGVVSLVGAGITQTLIANDGEAWMLVGNVVVDAEVANVSLRIRVTGLAVTNISWVAHARLVQVNY